MSNIRRLRDQLLLSSATVVLTAAGSTAFAATTTTESAQSIVGVTQSGSVYTVGATISETDGSAGVKSAGDVTGSTVTVG